MLDGSMERNRVLGTQLSELVCEKSRLREHERGRQRSLIVRLRSHRGEV